MLEKTAQRTVASAHPDHDTESTAVSPELLLLVRLIMRTINFSFLRFLIPDQGVKVEAAKSPPRCSINGKHTAATGWYRRQ